MYRQWWLSEKLPQWLPNMLQRYDRNIDLWQKWSDQFESLAASQEPGKQLPARISGPAKPRRKVGLTRNR